MKRLAVPVWLLVTVGGVVLGTSAHGSMTFSHLECWKLKDDLPKTTYTVDQFAESGCVVKTPPILNCTKTFKTNVIPPPPGGGPDVEVSVTNFLCYKEKCPKIIPFGTFTDQFGVHHDNVAHKKVGASLLCVPASPSGAFLDAQL